jgi:ribosomal protein S18 acetylase RimI-like enzyme
MIAANTPVRLAVLTDAASIAALSRDCIEFGLPWTWREGRVRRSILSRDTNVAVVESEGAIVGFGVMTYADDEASLLLFAVDSTHRRRGIGSAILLWLEDVARAAGVERIRLETRRESIAARSFYNELGYHERVIEKGRYGGFVDGIHLEKWLRVPMRESEI